jgi:methyltransferase (TIGR00027 family)
MSRGRPSRTATKIARFMLLLDGVLRLKQVLPAGSAQTVEEILRASGAVRARDIDTMRSPLTVRLYETAEKVLGRGQVLWFGVRKRWISEAVEQSLAAGARQLLVVGSGFDPLAVMVARRHPEVLCVEVDAPATALPKRTGIERAGLACPNHVVSASDLASTPLQQVLQPTGWRANVRSVVVAEGLLMYLPPPAVVKLLSAVRLSTCPGSRFAFTAVDEDEDGRPRVLFNDGLLNRFIQSALRVAGEAMHWGISPSSVPAFLGAAGYLPLEQPTPRTLRERFLDPLGLHEEPLAPYEHLTLAEHTRGT